MVLSKQYKLFAYLQLNNLYWSYMYYFILNFNLA